MGTATTGTPGVAGTVPDSGSSSSATEVPAAVAGGRQQTSKRSRSAGPTSPRLTSSQSLRHSVTDWLRPLTTTAGRLLRTPLASYYLVLGSAGLMLAIGVVMVLSASSVASLNDFGTPYTLFIRQLMWVAIGVPLAWLVSRQPIRRIRRLALVGMVTAVALLLLTFVPGIGVEIGGNRNWISFGGPFRLQPSELAKLALVVWGADVYARKGDKVAQWRHLLLPYMAGAGLVIALVVGQRDLGTALVLMAIVLVQLWVVGVPTSVFVGASLFVASIAAYFVMGSQNRIRRVTGFLDPFADPEGTGYQVAHSIYAFGSGGWWGEGLGASKQKWGTLPAAHTDFIFAVIGEELGFVGAVTVLALILTLGYAGIRIALRASDPFVRLLAGGVTGWLMCQAFVNLGVVLGLLPVIGIPLPLISYGGSGLVPTLLAIGLLLACAREEPGAADALRARTAAFNSQRAANRLARQSLREQRKATWAEGQAETRAESVAEPSEQQVR